MNSVIIANGTLVPTPAIISMLMEADLIIAADGGAIHLKTLDIPPHVIIGDLDSISPEVMEFFKKAGTLIIPHPPKKNNTDTDLCIDWAVKKGATCITFLGVTGNRLDHTLTNILLLSRLARQKIDAKIIDAHNEIFLVRDKLILEGRKGDLLSVIPVSEKVRGLTLKGVQYPLENHCIPMGSSLGISNCFAGPKAFISLSKGAVVVTRSRD